MGFFGSMKRNTKIMKAELAVKDIYGEIGVIKSSIERGRPVTKDYVLKQMDAAKQAYNVLYPEYKEHGLEVNTLFASMYPDIGFEVEQLKKAQETLTEILEKHYAEDK